MRFLGGPDFLSIALPAFFAAKAGNEVSPGLFDFYGGLALEADRAALEKTIAVIMQDIGKEVKQLAVLGSEVPILLIHGDSDENTPLEGTSRVLKEMLPWAELKVYGKGGHREYTAFWNRERSEQRMWADS